MASFSPFAYSDIAFIPKEVAIRWGNETIKWVKWQLEIYAEPLEKFKQKYIDL